MRRRAYGRPYSVLYCLEQNNFPASDERDESEGTDQMRTRRTSPRGHVQTRDALKLRHVSCHQLDVRRQDDRRDQ